MGSAVFLTSLLNSYVTKLVDFTNGFGADELVRFSLDLRRYSHRFSLKRIFLKLDPNMSDKLTKRCVQTSKHETYPTFSCVFLSGIQSVKQIIVYRVKVITNSLNSSL